MLPRDVVDRIAAGEVVERPASVVKELVENALDAGATRIDLELEEGGGTLVRVADNGSGIEEGDLPLAFASHATSKIQDPEELTHVASLGFRGEALASIAAVSRARIRSRVPGSDEAVEVVSTAGDIGEVRPAGGPEGTLVEVRDIFFNTPARRRFLRTVRSETGRVVDWLTRLALSRPDVAFRMVSNGRETFHYPVEKGLAHRIKRIFGQEIHKKLLPVDRTSSSMRLTGFVLPPDVDRPNTRFIFLFVNGRFIRDKTWLAGLREAYRGLMMRGRSPVAFLFLTLDPAEVDVNVHPTKEEVRFREGSRLFSLTVKAVREALGRADLRPSIEGGRPRIPRAYSETLSETMGSHGPTLVQERPPAPPPAPRGGQAVPVASTWEVPRRAGDVMAEDIPWEQTGGREEDLDTTGVGASARGVQFLKTYLFQELPGGLAVTDQHALHERILFEEIKARLREGPLPVQRLLVPEMVKVTAREMALLDVARPRLASLGLLVASSGTGRVAVEGVPEVLRKVSPETWLREVIAHLEGTEDRADLEDLDSLDGADVLTDDWVALMACRAAVKAGDMLNPEDIQVLLTQGEAVEKSPFCPHGRPVTVHITRAELERWFRRSV